jgi:hypothetical protein
LDTTGSKLIEILKVLEECANDLNTEIDARYSGTLKYPDMLYRYNRDMIPVNKANAILDASRNS